MEDNPKLDDFLLFLAVADGGGLSGAVKSTGTPAPTLSRRMADLERRLGKRLFERGKRGYSLTADGRALVVQAEPLRAAARRLSAFNAVQTRPRVRITAGHWTSQFISKRMGTVWTPEAIWIPELVASNAMVDIARREADIGIRKGRPDQPWLAGRRTGTITYAEFATSEAVQGYIALPQDTPSTPSQRWLRNEKSEEIVTTASDTRAEADLALGGIGRVVLPVFVGKSLEGLVQVSPEIDGLTHDEWLVSHHDARHDPPVRAAIEAVATILMARNQTHP